MGVVVTEGHPLQGTLFDRKLTKLLGKIENKPIRGIKAGTHQVLFIWYEALKLKLRTDWKEPAHVYRRQRAVSPFEAIAPKYEKSKLVWEAYEPVHWFDPGILLSVNEAILISAIDEVYSELRLVDRIIASRQYSQASIAYEVQEPAHFRRVFEQPQVRAKDVLSELAAVLRRHGY
jgi:hypothetical protein